VAQMAAEAHRRYAEIMSDVEHMIDDHSVFHALSNFKGNSLKAIP